MHEIKKAHLEMNPTHCEKKIKLKKVSKHANQKMNGHDNLFTVVCRHKMVDKGQ